MPGSDRAAGPASVSKLRTTIIVATLSALALLVSFAPFDLWPLIVFWPAGMAWIAVHASSTRSAVFAVGPTQFAAWSIINAWMGHIAGVSFILLAAYLSLYGMLAIVLLRRIVRHPRFGEWPMALILPFVWMLTEVLRGEVVLTGYPWYLVAHPFVEAPVLVQSADLFGTYVVGGMVAALSGAIVDAARVRGGGCPRRRAVTAATAVAMLWTANVAYGILRLGQEGLEPGPRVLAIQTNLPQDNKVRWTKDDQRRDLTSFIDLTRAAVQRDSAVDVIAWPETMVPGIGFEPDAREAAARLGETAAHVIEHVDRVEALQRELGVPMLVGSPAWVGTTLERGTDADGRPIVFLEKRRSHNSVYLLDGAPPHDRYDKTKLTPFGETIPYASAWPWLEETILAIGLGARGMRFDLDADPTITRFTIASPSGPAIAATPICFEDALPRLCRRMVYDGGTKVADALVTLSNDGWFGPDEAGRRHHAQLSRFRCIENRVPMVRCANTGMTVAIDSAGRLIAAVGDGRYGTGRVSGSMRVELPRDRRHTLYGRIGEWAAAAMAGLGLLLVAASWRRRTS